MERLRSYVFTVDQWSFKAKTVSEVNSDGVTVAKDVIEAISNEGGESMILYTGKYALQLMKDLNVTYFLSI